MNDPRIAEARSMFYMLVRHDETWVASPPNTTPRAQIECYDDMVQARAIEDVDYHHLNGSF